MTTQEKARLIIQDIVSEKGNWPVVLTSIEASEEYEKNTIEIRGQPLGDFLRIEVMLWEEKPPSFLTLERKK